MFSKGRVVILMSSVAIASSVIRRHNHLYTGDQSRLAIQELQRHEKLPQR
jgi:hypothetical protein